MPKPDPKLKTKYETTDPDYNPGSADSSAEQSRLQPDRKTKTTSVSDNSETPVESIILKPNSSHQDNIVTIDLINSPDDNSNSSIKPNILSSQVLQSLQSRWTKIKSVKSSQLFLQHKQRVKRSEVLSQKSI